MSSLGETLPSIPKLRVESGGEEEGTRTTRIRKPTSKRVGEWLYFGEVYASSSEQTEQEQEGAEQGEIELEEEVRSAFSTLICASLFLPLAVALRTIPLIKLTLP